MILYSKRLFPDWPRLGRGFVTSGTDQRTIVMLINMENYLVSISNMVIDYDLRDCLGPKRMAPPKMVKKKKRGNAKVIVSLTPENSHLFL